LVERPWKRDASGASLAKCLAAVVNQHRYLAAPPFGAHDDL